MTSSYGGSVYFSPSAVIAPHESLKNSYMVKTPSSVREMAREGYGGDEEGGKAKEETMSCKDQCFTTLGCSRWLSVDTRNKQTGLKLQDAKNKLNGLLKENDKNKLATEKDLEDSAANLEVLKQELISINANSMISPDHKLIKSKDKFMTPAKYKILLNRIKSKVDDVKRAERRLDKIQTKEGVIKNYIDKMERTRDLTADYVSVLASLDQKLLGIDHLKNNSIDAIQNANSAAVKLDVIEGTTEEIATTLEANDIDEVDDFSKSSPDFLKVLEECSASSIPQP